MSWIPYLHIKDEFNAAQTVPPKGFDAESDYGCSPWCHCNLYLLTQKEC